MWVCDGVAADYIREELNYPEARQVAYIKKLVYENNKPIRQENWYGVTSCSRSELSPKKFLETVRKHWEIENGLHHVKDRSWFEDHQYCKDQRLGGTLGALRNLSLNAMRTIVPPSRDRKKRKYDKSLPKQALAYLMAPLRTLMKLAQI